MLPNRLAPQPAPQPTLPVTVPEAASVAQQTSPKTDDTSAANRLPQERAAGAAGGTMRRMLSGAALKQKPDSNFPRLLTYADFVDSDSQLKELGNAPVTHDTWRSSCTPVLSYKEECQRHFNEAVVSGNKDRMEYLLAHADFSKHFDPNEHLCETVRSGDTAALKALLSIPGKFNPNCSVDTASGSHCPLVLAVFSSKPNKLELVKMLLEAGADPNFSYDTLVTWQTPLQQAVDSDKDGTLIKMFLESDAGRKMPEEEKAKIYSDVFLRGASMGEVALVGAFMEAYLGKNTSDEEMADKLRKALSSAIKGDNPGIVEELLAHGADIGAPLEDGKNPLTLAVEQRSYSTVQFLMKNGLKPSAKEVEMLPAYLRPKD